jgi:hypothetical protein
MGSLRITHPLTNLNPINKPIPRSLEDGQQIMPSRTVRRKKIIKDVNEQDQPDSHHTHSARICWMDDIAGDGGGGGGGGDDVGELADQVAVEVIHVRLSQGKRRIRTSRTSSGHRRSGMSVSSVLSVATDCP